MISVSYLQFTSSVVYVKRRYTYNVLIPRLWEIAEKSIAPLDISHPFMCAVCFLDFIRVVFMGKECGKSLVVKNVRSHRDSLYPSRFGTFFFLPLFSLQVEFTSIFLSFLLLLLSCRHLYFASALSAKHEALKEVVA